jgi:hypothetical protein
MARRNGAVVPTCEIRQGLQDLRRDSQNRRSIGHPAKHARWNGVLDDKTIYEIGAYLETLALEDANWKEGVKH